MTINPGIDVIINLGMEPQGVEIRQEIEAKRGHRPVHVITLAADQLDDYNPEFTRILQMVDKHSRITINGHSKPRGSTMQFENLPGADLPVTTRTKHFSEIADYIAARIDPSKFNIKDPLHIRLYSCSPARGGKQSLAAKFQRHFLVAHILPTRITGRTELLFPDREGTYTMSDTEYTYRLFIQQLGERRKGVSAAEISKVYFIQESRDKEEHRRRAGTKKVFTVAADGSQQIRDSYDPTSVPYTILPPVSDDERAHYTTHQAIVENKMCRVESLSVLTRMPPQCIACIRNYYLYQLKYELATEHIDELIKNIENLLVELNAHDQLVENFDPIARAKIIDKHMIEIDEQLHNIIRGSASEGRARAYHESLLRVLSPAKVKDYQEASRRQRELLGREIRAALHAMREEIPPVREVPAA